MEAFWSWLVWWEIGLLGGAALIFARLLWKDRHCQEAHNYLEDNMTPVREALRELGEVQEMATARRMRRAVGYCQNTDCEDYAKGVFLLNHGPVFYCPRCRNIGEVVDEVGSYTGNSEIFKEVRVEYNYDPIHRVYREVAIIRDDGIWGQHNVYTLTSPLIKTERRALKVAEAMLSSLNTYHGFIGAANGELPRTNEHILDMDKPREEFRQELEKFHKELETSTLRQKGTRAC
jgi:hypothetical protein